MSARDKIKSALMSCKRTIPVKHPDIAKKVNEALALLETHAFVPLEPSEAMIKVAYSKKYTAWHSGHTNCEIYKAIIQAAKEGA